LFYLVAPSLWHHFGPLITTNHVLVFPPGQRICRWLNPASGGTFFFVFFSACLANWGDPGVGWLFLCHGARGAQDSRSFRSLGLAYLVIAEFGAPRSAPTAALLVWLGDAFPCRSGTPPRRSRTWQSGRGAGHGIHLQFGRAIAPPAAFLSLVQLQEPVDSWPLQQPLCSRDVPAPRTAEKVLSQHVAAPD